ncbi:c-type cytochrome biogenesis protein CcmI [Salinimonas marina]|uniref:C-type cytochrome biogenesis protein CcmI n=1 Tax=Salinimonas marina TaxID=2785918 RepID=A0A7S9DWC2_9ALTE|nr:c-type cytochrome biogenesis protein CcmI [Salinimonas marina]QPG05042.1 c-type cytochrome biogenesis protein CcmI [Salinimonas marina]
MSWFHIAVAGLLTLLVILVALPWLGRQRLASKQTDDNTRLIQDRLAELEAEASQGMISDQDLRQACDELKLALVDEHRRDSAFANAAGRLWVVLGAILAIAGGSLTYYKVNQLPQVAHSQQAIEALPALSQKLQTGSARDITDTDISQLALAIRQRLHRNPEDAQGWMFLARMQASLNRRAQALEAMEKAYRLKPRDEAILMSYVQLLMGAGEREQVAMARDILAQKLIHEPDNLRYALMMAVASAQLGDLPATQRYYSQIKPKLPPESEMLRSLEQRITELSQQAGPPVQTALAVTVTLSESFPAEAIPGEGYLLVFAQQQDSENRMPAAVVKQPLSGFPVTVTLSVSDAMMPGFTLAELDQVKLIARISSDEDVMPSPGDLQGAISFDLVQGRLTKHAIEINKELK